MPMNWRSDFWDSITINLIETKLIIKERDIYSALENKTIKKRFKDIKRYQKLLTEVDMGEPLYITSKALNMIGSDMRDDRVFILDGSRRLVANILNKTNPNIILIDLKDSQ